MLIPEHKFYTTAELAKTMKMSREKIGMLRKYGLICGTHAAHGYVYRDDDVDRFWNLCRGADLRNEQCIRAFAQTLAIKAEKEKRA